MYNYHFGFAEAPFSIAPDPRYLYLSEQHREALAHLLYGIGDHGGFVVLTGEVGTGKTTVCRCLLQQVPQHIDVAFIVNPKLTSQELLQSICDELAVAVPEGEHSGKQLIDALNQYLLATHARGRNTILIIDEAQNLSEDVLEQLRLLTNLETNDRKLLKLILLGQPELNTLLARPSLRQLAQRITARYHLRPLSRDEVTRYIEHRLAIAGCRGHLFTPGAIARIYRLSQGIPRLINLLCDRALLGVYASNGNLVDTTMVRRAATEVLPPRRAPWRRLLPVVAVAALAGAALTLALWAVLKTAPEGAGAPATAAAAQPDWRASLARSGADESVALRRLYTLWGKKPENAKTALTCAEPIDPVLRCVHLQEATFDALKRYNKPVVLRLQDGAAAEPRFAVLQHVGSDGAQVYFGGREWRIPWPELLAQWRGEALLLVAAPVEQLPLQPGASGALVAWLDERLYRHFHRDEPRWLRENHDRSDALIDGVAKQAWLASHYLALHQQVPGTVYDAALLAQVKRFQQEQGLPDTGQIDVDTVLVISRLLDAEQPRLSDESVQRGS